MVILGVIVAGGPPQNQNWSQFSWQLGSQGLVCRVTYLLEDMCSTFHVLRELQESAPCWLMVGFRTAYQTRICPVWSVGVSIMRTLGAVYFMRSSRRILTLGKSAAFLTKASASALLRWSFDEIRCNRQSSDLDVTRCNRRSSIQRSRISPSRAVCIDCASTTTHLNGLRGDSLQTFVRRKPVPLHIAASGQTFSALIMRMRRCLYAWRLWHRRICDSESGV